jgi:DnaJ-class molecular chaperone
MDDPYVVLGVPTDADDEAIRRAYLAMVKQYPPERAPERFAAVRAAYEQLRDADTRIRSRLFEVARDEDLDRIIEELSCRSSRRRLSLKDLLSAMKR